MLAAQEYEDGVRKKYHLSPDTSFGDLAKMETQREGRMLELQELQKKIWDLQNEVDAQKREAKKLEAKLAEASGVLPLVK